MDKVSVVERVHKNEAYRWCKSNEQQFVINLEKEMKVAYCIGIVMSVTSFVACLLMGFYCLYLGNILAFSNCFVCALLNVLPTIMCYDKLKLEIQISKIKEKHKWME